MVSPVQFQLNLEIYNQQEYFGRVSWWICLFTWVYTTIIYLAHILLPVDILCIDVIMVENEKFTGDMPSELGQLESLSVLSLGKYGSFRFTDDRLMLISYIVLWLCFDIMLAINVGNNLLVSTVPTELGALSELSTLDIGKTHIAIHCFECGDSFIWLSWFLNRNKQWS